MDLWIKINYQLEELYRPFAVVLSKTSQVGCRVHYCEDALERCHQEWFFFTIWLFLFCWNSQFQGWGAPWIFARGGTRWRSVTFKISQLWNIFSVRTVLSLLNEQILNHFHLQHQGKCRMANMKNWLSDSAPRPAKIISVNLALYITRPYVLCLPTLPSNE